MGASTPLDAAIAALAERQWGVVSAAQLRLLGATREAIDVRVQSGRLHRVFRGVHCVGHRPLHWETWWMAAVLLGGDRAALSHRSAAELYGWMKPSRDHPIDVTIAGNGGRKPRGNPNIRRSRTLTPDRVTVHRGIPVTAPARTLRDLRPLAPRWQWLQAVNQAEVDGLLTRADLDRLFPGAADGTRSDNERRLLAICRRHGIPLPQTNVVVGGRLVDAHWPDANLAVEIDSRRYHGTATAFERDRERGNDLTVAGVPLLRFTDLRLEHDAAGVAGDIRRTRARLLGAR